MEVESYCGVTVSGNLMYLQEISASPLKSEVQGGRAETNDRDIWSKLEPGPFDGGLTASDLKRSLHNDAQSHSWSNRTEEFLDQRLKAPTGLGLGVPYAAGPMIRAAMRQVLADIGRDLFGRRDPRKWGSTVPANVVGIELPIAVAIERHSNGERGMCGIVSWGTGLIEITVVKVTSDAIVVRAFRESDRSSAATVCRELTDGFDPSFRWLVVPPVDFVIEELRRFSTAESVSLDAASRGVARYAHARSSPAAFDALPQIHRVVPRALGIVGCNSNGELFWHRLLGAGEASGESPWEIDGFSGKPGTIATAAWADRSCPPRWLAQSQWSGRLHWWQEPLTVQPPAPVDEELKPINLICKAEEDGFLLALEAPSSAAAGPT